MVSIHRVPVVAYLIIRVIYFTFRFKREASYLLLAPPLKAFALPVRRNEQREASRRYVYTTPYITPIITISTTKEHENIPMRHSPLLCF